MSSCWSCCSALKVLFLIVAAASTFVQPGSSSFASNQYSKQWRSSGRSSSTCPSTHYNQQFSTRPFRTKQEPSPNKGTTVRQKRDSSSESIQNAKAKPPKRPSRKERKATERRIDYERRRKLWTTQYGSVEALKKRFGAGPIWGDLTPQETRRLYHTLLPRSLVGLNELGLMKPEELAPLAYEARIAAKGYARSRCDATGRIAAVLFDEYRSLRDYGRFGAGGSMTWEQVWNKYEAQIVAEECSEELDSLGAATNATATTATATPPKSNKRMLDEEELTSRIYLRILERSCATNQAFDDMFLKGKNGEDSDLAEIASKLDNGVREILLRPQENARAIKITQQMDKQREKAEWKRQKQLERWKKKLAKRRKESQTVSVQEVKEDPEFVESPSTAWSDPQRVYVLRIMAGTRRYFRRLLEDTPSR